jgi:multimeric flavodoxin WrbA
MRTTRRYGIIAGAAGLMKRLLIIYHTQTGNTESMTRAVEEGARELPVTIRTLLAARAGAQDLLWCDGLLLGTPENFGYMSGAIKDFMDRTYYPLEGKVQGLPYAIFISAGNDGSGALGSIRRIASGYGLKEVMEPVVAQGSLTDDVLLRCREMGMAMAAGLDAGIY